MSKGDHTYSLDELRLKLDELRNAEEDLLYRLVDVRASIDEARLEIERVLKETRVDVTAGLPDEILSEIFEQGRHLSPPYVFQENVCCVSRRWRNVAIHTPSLWSELFDRHSTLDDGPDVLRNRFKTYLSRSRDRFLDIKLFDFPEFWPRIQPHAHRIYSLSLHLNPRLVDKLATANVPNLRHLHLLGESWNVSFRPHMFSGGAPLLTSLKLDGDFDVSGIRFSSLTTLEIGSCVDDIPFADLRDMILSSPSLTTLKLSSLLINDKDRVVGQQIHIPSLQSLHIEFFDPNILDMAYSFSTPEVKDLCIPGSTTKDLQVTPAQLELLSISYPHVRKMAIRNDDYLTLLAPAFPNITNLTVIRDKYEERNNKYTKRDNKYTKRDIPQLLGDICDPEKSIWPHLRELTIRLVDAQASDSLYHMLCSRRTAGFPVATLHLICEIGSDIDWTYRLRRLANVDVTFTFTDPDRMTDRPAKIWK